MSSTNTNNDFEKNLIRTIYDITGELFLSDDRVVIRSFNGDDAKVGNTYDMNNLKCMLDKVLVSDIDGVESLTVDGIHEMYNDGIRGKTFCFSIEREHNIIRWYELAFYPQKGQEKVLVTIREIDKKEDAITLMLNKKPVTVYLKDILYVDYGNHSVDIYTDGKKTSFFSVAFNDVARVLMKHTRFLRSYKNCIINMDRVERIENDSFVMDDNEIISIPKRRLKEIKAIYEAYILKQKNRL